MMENNEEKKSKQLTSQDTMQLVWLLVGGGTLGSVYLLLKRNRNIFFWLIPVGMIAVGIDLFLSERHEGIKATGDEIIDLLDELDPIARAEVVKYMADQEMERISR